MHSSSASFVRAQELDESDSLGQYRHRFYVPAGQIYLDGNSLGLLSRDAERTLLNVLQNWKTGGIGGWLDGDAPWFTMAEALAERVAKLIGAAGDEVAIANSMTINLHQLLATLYRPRAKRTKVLIDAHSFPTDRYALRSHLRLRGLDPTNTLSSSRPAIRVFSMKTKSSRHSRTPSCRWRSSRRLSIPLGNCSTWKELSRRARERCHRRPRSFAFRRHPAARARRLGADFAGWGHYKWLNAGPGSVAGLYLNRRHFNETGVVDAGLAGWWSVHKESMFEMSDEFFPGWVRRLCKSARPPS